MKFGVLLKRYSDVLGNFMNILGRTGMITLKFCGEISMLVSLIAQLLKVKPSQLIFVAIYTVPITEINFGINVAQFFVLLLQIYS